MDENEELGKIFIDGKVINLDSVPISELENLEKKLEKEIEVKKETIENYLFSETDEDEM